MLSVGPGEHLAGFQAQEAPGKCCINERAEWFNSNAFNSHHIANWMQMKIKCAIKKRKKESLLTMAHDPDETLGSRGLSLLRGQSSVSKVEQADQSPAKKETCCALGEGVGVAALYPGKGQRRLSVEAVLRMNALGFCLQRRSCRAAGARPQVPLVPQVPLLPTPAGG